MHEIFNNKAKHHEIVAVHLSSGSFGPGMSALVLGHMKRSALSAGVPVFTLMRNVHTHSQIKGPRILTFAERLWLFRGLKLHYKVV